MDDSGIIPDDEYTMILIQGRQIAESLNGCPGECFASDFLQNYSTLCRAYDILRTRMSKRDQKLLELEKRVKEVEKESKNEGDP